MRNEINEQQQRQQQQHEKLRGTQAIKNRGKLCKRITGTHARTHTANEIKKLAKIK